MKDPWIQEPWYLRVGCLAQVGAASVWVSGVTS